MSHVSFGASTGALTAIRSASRVFDASQNAVASGRTVNTAADDPALYAVAAKMSGDSSGYAAVSEALGLGKATVSIGRAAAEKVTGALNEIRSHVIAASAPGADTAAMQSQIDALGDQIGSLVKGASFSGANLLQGGAGDSMELLSWTGSGGQPQHISVANQSLLGANGQGGALGALSGLDVSSAEGRAQALETIDGLMQSAAGSAAALGSAEAHIDRQSEALSDLARSVNAGLSALVDTNLEEESAKMAAAGVQKALATEMQAISNAQSRNVLTLFEGVA